MGGGGAADGAEAPFPGGVFRGLRTRLVVLVLIAVLPASGILVRSAAQDRKRILADAEESAQQHARVAAAQAGEILDAAAPYVELLARHTVVTGGDAEAQAALFRDVCAADPRYLNVGLIALDGSVRASAVTQAPGTNLRDRAYFRRARDTGRTSLGTYQIGRIHGEPSINVGTPVRDAAGATSGVLFAAVGLDRLVATGSASPRPGDAAAALIGPSGLVLALHPDPKGLRKTTQTDTLLVRAIAASREHRARVEGLDGVERSWGWVAVRHRGEDTGGTLAVGLSTDAAEVAADRKLVENLIALGVAAALALAVAWVAGDFLVVRRARTLVDVTRRIAAGDLAARVGPTSGGGEIGAVARSVDAMAAALEQRESELRRAEARYRALVEQTPAVFYVTGSDVRERTVHVGSDVGALFGFDAATWRSSPRLWAERIHPDDAPRVLDEMRRAAKELGTFSTEYRLVDRDGGAVWVRDAGSARREGDAVRIAGLLVDVTEVKSLHERLLRGEQLAAAGRVASGVARDVEDHASSVLRHARAALARVEGDELTKGHLEGVLRAVDRMASLAADLRAFGGVQKLVPQAVEVNGAIERLLPEIRHAAGPNVEVATLLAPGVRPAWVDPAGLDHAILRLADHAARNVRDDRRDRGRRLTVGTLDVLLDETAAKRAGVPPGSYVVIAFGEAGASVGGDVPAQAFEPFASKDSPSGGGAGPGSGPGTGSGASSVTTSSGSGSHPVRRSSGLAVASVFGFARQSGGTAEAAGEPGKGASWRLLLPCPR